MSAPRFPLCSVADAQSSLPHYGNKSLHDALERERKGCQRKSMIALLERELRRRMKPA